VKPVSLLMSALVLSAWLPAHAQQRLLPEQSEIVFVSKQMGVPVEGRFRRFDAQIAFDPAQLARSQVSFSVDVASATLGVRETDAELPKPVWFDTARFPQATFRSTAVRALGGGRYEADGELTLKGVVAPVKVPFTLAESPAGKGVSIASGSFAVQRLTFKVGDREWSDTSMVANEVQVRFKLALSGVAAR
jgi:polyisoprenoid-binding protein YceI